MNVLRAQAVAVAISQGIIEHIDGFLAAAELPPRVDQPETTDQESRLRQAEIVLAGITHNVLAAQKFTLDGIDGSHETRVAHLHQSDFRQQQDAGIEFVDADAGREGTSLLVPGLLEQSRLNSVGDIRPMRRALLHSEMLRDGGEA